MASTSGKIELETLGETSEDKILAKLMQRAVLNVFNRRFKTAELDEVVKGFEGGLRIEASDTMPVADYVRQLGQVKGLETAVSRLGAAEPSTIASAVEFVLEGLHLSRKLNKDVQSGGASRYRG